MVVVGFLENNGSVFFFYTGDFCILGLTTV